MKKSKTSTKRKRVFQIALKCGEDIQCFCYAKAKIIISINKN